MKLLKVIEEISLDFIMGTLSTKKVIEKEKENLVRLINKQIYIFYKINPKSKLEQLMDFTQNFQKVLNMHMDFPSIKNEAFKKNEKFFKPPDMIL